MNREEFEAKKAAIIEAAKAKGQDTDLTPLEAERLKMTTEAIEVLGYCAHDEKLGPRMAQYITESVEAVDTIFVGKEEENKVSKTFMLAIRDFMRDAKKFPPLPAPSHVQPEVVDEGAVSEAVPVTPGSTPEPTTEG